LAKPALNAIFFSEAQLERVPPMSISGFFRRFRRRGTIIPVVRLSGAIGISAPFRPGLNLAGIESSLERAFRFKNAPAVAILINSPGGAAVQSHLIHRRIRSLAAEKRKRVIVAVEDVAASG
jgi:serine protease SohB